MINGTLLIADADKKDLLSLQKLLVSEAERVITVNDPNRIPEMLGSHEVEIVIMETDFHAKISSGNEGLFWMKEVFRHDNDIVVVMVTRAGNIELAVKAIRQGAFDFIVKPWDRLKVTATINAAWKLRQSRLETARLKNDNRILKKEIIRGGEKIVQGASPTMIHVMNMVRKVAPTDANVLICGENGTGKELIAREIHNLSARKGRTMVNVDMGSIPESLIESELFGHTRGAFTDAREERKGKFEEAHRTTLFLDEIGNLSFQSQSKLLSALQNRSIVRVGSNKNIPVDIRLICATNRNLQEMVSRGEFREDLYYRINTIIIEVPPLRDRVDDIPILANYFLRVHSERYGKQGLKISTNTMEKLSNHPWPGNVRELQHAIEKAVIMSESLVIKPSDFAFTGDKKTASHHDETLSSIEKKAIEEALRKYSGNMSVVAEKLGITRQTLYNKVKNYGI